MAVAAVPCAALAAPTAADFDAIGNRALQTRTAPGFAFAVVRSGSAVYARGFGVADVARNQPVATNTRFAVGSLSKQFTAVAILKLRDAGALRLDDPLSAYLPNLPNAPRITLRMLLNHTSGLHNYPNTNEHPWPLSGAIDPAALFAIMAADPVDFQPGERYGYTNTDYAALAGVVARASRLTFGTYLTDRVIGPTGMTSSGNGYAAQLAGVATAYTGTGSFAPAQPLSLDLFYGAGSIVSTADDLVRWDVALLHGTLLGAASMHDLWTAGTLANGTPVPYAMGFVPDTLYGHREVWHNGYVPGTGGYCYNAIFPDDDLAVIVLSNGADFRGNPEAMVRSVVEAYFPVAPSPGDDRAGALALRLLHDLRAGDISRDAGDLTPAMQAALTPAVVAQTRDAYFPFGGDPTAFRLAARTNAGGGLVQYTYRANFANGVAHDVVMTLDASGKVAGFVVQ